MRKEIRKVGRGGCNGKGGPQRSVQTRMKEVKGKDGRDRAGENGRQGGEGDELR